MKVRPFAQQGQYTAVPDYAFDHVMPHVTPPTWKVLCYIIRRTRGFQRTADRFSYAQIREGTGIRSDGTVRRALEELTSRELVVIERGGLLEASLYSLNLEFEADVPDRSTESVERTTASVERTTGTVERTTTGTVERSIYDKQLETNNTDRGRSGSRWDILHDAISETYGGIATRKKNGAPYYWVGRILNVAGQHSGNDPDVALHLWRSWVSSIEDRRYMPGTDKAHERFGVWLAGRTGDGGAAVKF